MSPEEKSQRLIDLCDEYAEIHDIYLFLCDATIALLESDNHIDSKSIEGLRLINRQIKHRLHNYQTKIEALSESNTMNKSNHFPA